MGRRRHINRITLTTMAISVETAEEWQDLKEYRLDMDLVIKLKERQISNLENELLLLKNNSYSSGRSNNDNSSTAVLINQK